LGFDKMTFAESNQKAIDAIVEHGCAVNGDLVIISKGDVLNVHGSTNTMKILEVGQPIVNAIV